MEFLELQKTKAKATPKKYKCPICKDKKVIYTQKDGYSYARDCICVKKERWIKRLKRQNLLDRYNHDTFENFKIINKELENAVNIAKAYSKDYKNKSLMILGKSGTGKTHLALSTLKEIVKNEIKSINPVYPDIVFFSDLIQKLKDSQSYTSNFSEFEILDRYKKSEVLFIDDFLKFAKDERTLGWMFNLITSRYNERKSTIVTSELFLPQIIQLDQALGTRLTEMANGKYLIQLNTRNMRI